MIDENDLEQAERVFAPSEPSFDRFLRRRDQKRRSRRITAGVVGMAVFVAALWSVASVGPLNRSETLVAPGASGTTAPTETEPTSTSGSKGVGVAPPQVGTVTRSGAGCALHVGANPIQPGAYGLDLLNQTNRWTSFELVRLDPWTTLTELEQALANGRYEPYAESGRGWSVLAQREVGPGKSDKITDNFRTGEAYVVVCGQPPPGPRPQPLPERATVPFAFVGPLKVM